MPPRLSRDHHGDRGLRHSRGPCPDGGLTRDNLAGWRRLALAAGREPLRGV